MSNRSVSSSTRPTSSKKENQKSSSKTGKEKDGKDSKGEKDNSAQKDIREKERGEYLFSAMQEISVELMCAQVLLERMYFSLFSLYPF